MNTLEARRRLLGRNVYKRTTEGNPAIAQGSLARMYPGITMQGWTEQDSTTGAQLFNKSTAISGKYISDTDGKELDGEDTYASDYIAVSGLSNIICSDTKSSRWMAFYDFEKTYISGVNGYASPIAVPDGAAYARFTVSNDYIDSFMVNAGQTLLPYEPYTGGQPSPNPDYPQEIISAGNYDEATGKYKYEVKLQGKNLFDFSNFISSGASMSVDYEKQTITIPARMNNVGYTNTLRDVLPDAIVGTTCVINAKTSNPEANRKIYLLNKQEKLKFGTPFKITDELLNDSFSWYNSPSTNNENVISEIQVEYGDTPTDYEPYRTPQTVLLQSDRPLTKWDKLEKRNGQWGWVYKSAEVVLDGSEDENWNVYNINRGFYVSGILPFTGNRREGYSDRMLIQTSDIPSGYFEAWIGVNNKNVYLLNAPEYDDELPDKGRQNFKDLISGKPITILTYLDEEIFTPLSENEQELMNALYTNRPTTVLSNDCDCNMILTYKTKKSMRGGGNPYGLEIGGLNGSGNGAEFETSNRIRTGFILFVSDDGTKTYQISGYSPYRIANKTAYDIDRNPIGLYPEYTPPAGTYYIRISFSKSDNSDFTQKELEDLIKTFQFKEVK